MIEHMETIEDMRKRKDVAYWERQQMVAALSHQFPAFLAKHPADDKDWQDDWRNIVVIILPCSEDEFERESPELQVYKIPGGDKTRGRQITWHIHDFDMPMFDHLSPQEPYMTNSSDNNPVFGIYTWDGHTTEEKYKRLREFFRIQRGA